MKPPDYIANFDSASAMLRATAASLHGQDFPLLGMLPRKMRIPAKMYGMMVNQLPRQLREQVYIWSGWGEAISTKRAGEIDIEHIAQWMVSEYPDRGTVPAIAVGSSNGALVHMYRAMQVPWLPQTVLVPIRRGRVHPDEPAEDIEKCRQAAADMLEANPDVALHQMHDPNQDRLMVERMAYFRVKKQKLGPSYEQFISDSLEPGGTIYLIECGLQWPVTNVRDRHYFQFGALGGLPADEYVQGSKRVTAYLQRYNSHKVRWEAPEADDQRPEAEWGFDSALRDDVERFAKEHGYRVRRISFDEPEDTSPMVADFYRQWNERRGITDNRLLVESFILMDPQLTMQTGSVPYWMVFNKEPSADNLERYLEQRDPFDEIHMMLFSHGVNSAGLAPIERWQRLLDKATVKGRFAGVTPDAFPRDFAVFARYYDGIAKGISRRYPVPERIEPQQFEQYIEESEDQYGVRIADLVQSTRRVAHAGKNNSG